MPISQSEFDQLVPNLGLTPEGQRYVSNVRSSPPSRLVQSDVLPNCRYRFVSKRMGFSVMAESHLEYRFILALEYESDELIEYWDQPLPVEIHGITKSERPFRSAYTADILAIYRDGVIAYRLSTLYVFCRFGPRARSHLRHVGRDAAFRDWAFLAGEPRLHFFRFTWMPWPPPRLVD
jgi:hypothetical protein